MSRKLQLQQNSIDIGAMWLPGFHQDVHNDEWWGEGFTEWDNVKNAKPLFEGHFQPVIPLDGYLEIDTVEEVLRQFNQAASFDISVIGCYHYWFEGERLLDVPEKLIGELDELPVRLFLYWANHSWSNAWTNSEGDPGLLIEQAYSLAGAREHGEYVSQLLVKGYYYRHNGNPVFFVYDGLDIFHKCPNYLKILRETVYALTGLNLDIVVTIRSEAELMSIKLMPIFYDRLFVFEPSFTLSKLKGRGSLEFVFSKMPVLVKGWLTKFYRLVDKSHQVFEYDEISNLLDLTSGSKPVDENKMIYSVCCGFDNTPRYKNRARIFCGFEPSKFKEKLKNIFVYSHTNNISLIMINALNEWGEGMHLQPCEDHELLKLNAIKEVSDDYCK